MAASAGPSGNDTPRRHSWGPYREHDGDVLQPGMSGGPHGLGDPDDMSLRRVEVEIMIPQKMKQRAKAEKCLAEVTEFGKCSKEQGLLLPFRCRAEVAIMKACLSAAYQDGAFRNECKQQYLDERSEYRRTGVSKKRREAEAAEVHST